MSVAPGRQALRELVHEYKTRTVRVGGPGHGRGHRARQTA